MSTPPSSSHGYTLGKNYLGGGLYADVWEATDRFKRPRAVKIVHKSKGAPSFIEQQARALARVNHKNVIKVHDLIDVPDPDTGEMALGIAMDVVNGPKLSVALAGGLAVADAKRIGSGLIDGVEAIHAEGLFHTDLHDENIIVGDPDVVIIDILYTKSAADLSTASRESRLQRDLLDVWHLLRAVLDAASVAAERIAEFDRKKATGGLVGLRTAFFAALESGAVAVPAEIIADAKAKFIDSAFVSGPDYAQAVVDSIPPAAGADTILGLLETKALRQDHQQALRLLFERLPVEDQQRVATKLAEHLDTEVPAGKWISPILLLAATAKLSWPMLPMRTRLRLEQALIDDIQKGSVDIHNFLSANAGALGTWSIKVWPLLRNPAAMCDALLGRLRTGWYGQNYVANRFFGVLPALAKQVGKEAEVIAALKSAYANDARVVKNNLKELPPPWQAQITAP